MRRYWLIFAQAVTVCLGILFVVTTLRPDLLRLAGPAAGPQSAAAAARPPAARTQATASYADGVARAAPSVVNVYTTKHVNVPLIPLPDDPVLRQFFGQVPGVTRRQASTSLGSGVIVNQDGYVLTNYHVVQAAEAIEVALSDGRRDTAKVVGADPDTDLAVLKLATLRSLPAATLAPDRGLRVGDVVLAIGNPFGVGQTTTLGIVSALGRNGLGLNTYENFIQTDAAINPGNSGGPLIDMRGRVVGINTAIYSRSGGSVGIGFAIPSAMVRLVVDSARAGVKTVKRPWFGARLQSLTAEVADGLGLDRPAGSVVASVVDKGPADQAGLKRSDVILSVDGVNVDDPESFGYRFATRPIGGTTMLSVLRGGKRISIPVKLVAAPETRPRDMVKLTSRSPLAGLTVGNMSPALAEELSIETGNDGVVVSEIEEGSTAANVGFQRGDIIKALNGEQMTTSREVEAILRDRRRAWEVTIIRNGQTITSVFPG